MATSESGGDQLHLTMHSCKGAGSKGSGDGFGCKAEVSAPHLPT